MGYGMDKFKFGLYQNLNANKSDSQIWPNFKLDQDFMPVLFIWKFHNDLIKINTLFRTQRQICFFFGTQEQVTQK